MAEKKEESLGLEDFVKTAEKGLSLVKEGKEYVAVLKSIKDSVVANASAMALLNKMEAANALQLVAVNGGLTTRQFLLGVLNGQITMSTAATLLWTKAQAGLNMVLAGNPIGLLVTAIGALLVGIQAYIMSTDEAALSTYKLTEEQEKNIQKAHEVYEAYTEMDNERKESMTSIATEYGYYEKLKNELLGIVDTNGRVKEGYEDRANFIVNHLAKAFGMEEEQIWEMINSNSNLEVSIDRVIQKKKAEAVLMANEKAYSQAIQERGDALSSYHESLKILDEKEKEYNKTKKAADEYNKRLESGNASRAESYFRAHKKEIEANEEAMNSYEEAKKAVKESEETYIGYIATIENYEGLSSAILAEDAEQIDIAMQNIMESFITAEVGTREALEKQVEDMETHYEELKEAFSNGMPGVTEEMVRQAEEMVTCSKEELQKVSEGVLLELTESLGNAGITMTQAMMDAISSKEPEMQEKVLNLLNQINAGVALKEEELMILLTNLGISTSDSLIGALAGKEVSVQAEAIQLISQLQTAEGVKREEVIARLNALGVDVGNGLTTGMDSKKTDVHNKTNEVISESEKAIDSCNLKNSSEEVGADVNKGLIKGLGSKIRELGTAAKNLAETILSSLRRRLGINSPSKEAAKLGNSTGFGFVKGLKKQLPDVKKASESLAETALQGMDVQAQLTKMRSAMSMEKAMIGANLTSRVVHEFVMGNQNDFMTIGEKMEALQNHMDNIRIQLQLEGKAYIDKREAGYILAPEINKRLGEFAELKGRGNNSR